MKAGTEERAGEIFLAAAMLSGEARERFVAAEVNGDSELRAEVESLLRADERNGEGFLDEPALGVGFNVMSAGSEAAATPSLGDESRRPGRIGAYHTLKVLAESDDVVVWLAEQREPVERRVAIKVLRSGAARRGVQKRFELERRAVALMEHPNIARLYDAGTTPDGRAYFAMEHVAGLPLTEACAGLSVRARLRLFVQACLGVEHAHQRGIIHRDLKPANLMVGQPGDDEACLKVIDFGVASAIRAGLEQHTGLTLQGQVLGTPGYLAPERLLDGTRDSGALADVYSLGAVLYEVLAGRPAFALEGKSTAAAIATVLREQPARLGAQNRWLRGDLEAIASTAMKAEPAERYQSVAELRRDVERYLAGRPVTARMPGPVYIARKFVGRHLVLTGVCAAAVLVAGAAQWRAQEATRDGCELAAEIAGSWLEHTVRMARTIGERDKRRPLLERLAQESERFEALAPNDVRILKIHAGVLGSLGDVAEEERRFTEAAVLMEEARALRERIMQVAPDDLNAEMDRSIAVVRCGDLASALGDPAKAEACYEQAMEFDRGILARASKNSRAVNNLAWSCHRLGVRATGNKNLDRAEMLLNEGFGLMNLAKQVRGSVDDVRGMADMHLQLAHLAKARGDGATEHQHLDESLTAADEARMLSPDNRLAQQQWLRSTIEYVSVCRHDKEGLSAREAWPRVLDETRRFVQRDLSDRDSQFLMCQAYGCALMSAKDADDVASVEQLGRLLEADLEAVLTERPGDEELEAARGAMRCHYEGVRQALGMPR